MSSWRALLAGLVAVRLVIPLAALAAEGRKLPGIPRYDYRPLNGDAEGFYSGAREFISAVARLGIFRSLVVAAAVTLAGILAWRFTRARVGLRWLGLVLPAFLLALALSVVIVEMEPTGAVTFGWPLVWSVPLAVLRLANAAGENAAFVVGLVLSLAANAVTVVATAFLGFYATGRRSVGLLAAAFFATWPLLTGLIAGERAWENGTWHADVGLHLYTEPLSTALTTVAAVLVLRQSAADSALLAGAGLALGLATAVKLSNGLLAAVTLLYLVWQRGVRPSIPFVAGAAALAPIVIAFWPIGYVPLYDNPSVFPEHPFSLDYGVRNWSQSLLFRPSTLAVLAPLAVLGAVTLRRRPALMLFAVWILTTAAFHSFYEATWEHPRFLFVVLPELFVLEAAGALFLAASLRRRPAAARPAPT